jgi:hypothetical protein
MLRGSTFIIIITFMQGVYSYVPDVNHVSKVYSVAGILQLQFMVHVTLLPMLNVLLYFYMSTFRIIVQCPIWLLRYFLNDFEMILVKLN